MSPEGSWTLIFSIKLPTASTGVSASQPQYMFSASQNVCCDWQYEAVQVAPAHSHDLAAVPIKKERGWKDNTAPSSYTVVKLMIDLWCHVPMMLRMILSSVTKTFQNMLVLQILNKGFMVNQHSKRVTKPKLKLLPHLTLQQEIVPEKAFYN